MTESPQEVVQQFLKDWEKGFVQAFERWMHPDVLWQNTGFPDANGKQAALALLARYQDVTGMPFGRVEMVSIAINGDRVLTERIDHLWGEGKEHSARIMGTFEVKDGLIKRYSDYFDASQFRPKAF